MLQIFGSSALGKKLKIRALTIINPVKFNYS